MIKKQRIVRNLQENNYKKLLADIQSHICSKEEKFNYN